MGLQQEGLDASTRRHMLDEFEYDLKYRRLYYSRWFSPRGRDKYPDLCRAALESGTDDTLASSLGDPGTFVQEYEKKKPKGGTTTANVPHTAPITFAEGEFNRFYLRGLCARIVAEGGGEVEVYRARQSANARSASEALIGSKINAATLLEDLRANIGVDTALGLPQGPNSGLSGRRVTP
jgi:hypothetical protein